jgi:phosphonate transport system substrate-binding protein
MLKNLSLLCLTLMSSVSFATPLKPTTPTPKKLVFAFQKQKDPRELAKNAKSLAAEISQDVGLPVEVLVPDSYTASVQALVSNRAQVAYMDAIPFLLAKKEAPVRVIMAEQRKGRTDYDSIFVVRKDSPYQTLADLKGKRMMFTSQTSTSGYVMAYDRLIKENFLKSAQDPKDFFKSANFAGSYDRALLSVLNNQADVAAVSDYTMEGQKADVYLPAAKREQLRVLTRTAGVPTHCVAVRSDLPQELQTKITQALVRISAEKPQLLSDVYGAAKLVEANDAHAQKAQDAIATTGLSLRQLVEEKE